MELFNTKFLEQVKKHCPVNAWLKVSMQDVMWLLLFVAVIAAFCFPFGFVFLIAAIIANIAYHQAEFSTFNGKAMVFLLYFLPFYTLIRLSLITLGIDLKLVNYVRDAVIVVMLLVALWHVLRQRITLEKWDWLWIVFIANWVIGAIVSVANGYLGLGITGLHYVAAPAMLYLIIRYGDFDMSGKRFMDLFIRVTMIVALTGLFVYVFRTEQFIALFKAGGSTTDPTRYVRLVSVFLTPNVCGNFLAIGFACTLAQWMQSNRAQYLAVAAVMLLSALLTMSRGTWLFLAVIFLVFLVMRPKLGKTVLLLGLVAVALLMLNIGNIPLVTVIRDRLLTIFDFENLSSYGRIDTWIASLASSVEHPLGLGIGVATTAQITHGNVAGVEVIDGFYVKTIVETGILGIVFCVAFLVWSIATSVTNLLKKRNSISLCALMVCFGCLIQATASNVFDFVCTAPWFWVLLALAAKEGPAEHGVFEEKKMKDKISILYLNQTPWDWILQRSQMLALGLDEKYDCIILDKQFVFSSHENLDNPQPKKLVRVPQLRGGGKIELIGKINDWIFAAMIRKYIYSCDAVWCCYAGFGKFIPKKYTGCVIYDCMDNHVALAPEKNKKQLFRDEQALIARSNILICSSQKLTEVVPGMENAAVIRNGFVSEEPLPAKAPANKERYTVGYFGAIEHWFDFEKIMLSTKQIPQLEYRLIGPFNPAKFSKDEAGFRKTLDESRIYLEGIVKHDDLKAYVKDYDALIMPFKINDVILSVDPVKLYEYICYGRCVISVWYPEIDRFSPYVYFYHNEEEYISLMKELVENGFRPKYNTKTQSAFLNENTWEQRSESVIRLIDEYFHQEK